MKRLILSVLSLLAIVSCTSSSEQTDTNYEPVPERYGWNESVALRGDVSSVVVTDSLGHILRSYLFNSRGDVLESALYAINGEVSDKVFYEYDASGRLLHKSVMRAGVRTLAFRYVYDSFGNLTEEHYPEFDETIYNSYNQSGQKVKSQLYAYAHSARYEYQYDVNGNQVAERRYTANSRTPMCVITKEYDTESRVVRRMVQNADGVYDSNISYEYDAFGNMNALQSYDDRGVVAYGVSCLYDDKSNLIQKRISSAQSNTIDVVKYEYEYDAQGNATCRRESSENGVVKGPEVLKYRIEYRK